jgi:hypothetical protein
LLNNYYQSAPEELLLRSSASTPQNPQFPEDLSQVSSGRPGTAFKVIYTNFAEDKGGSPVYFVSVDEVSSAMDTDTPTAQESDYGSSPWVDIGAFESPAPHHHSPPLPDFHGFSYASSSIMPIEPAYNITVPPPYSTLNFTMPPPNAWPSMMGTHAHYADTALSPASTPAPTISIPQPVPIRPLHATPASHAPTPRRTLTDEDRRRMCLYHEENKSAKQTDIGGGFSVIPCSDCFDLFGSCRRTSSGT